MAASNPTSSTSQRHLSSPPAMPTARQPLIRAICPTMLPTDPAAPETRTVWPGSADVEQAEVRGQPADTEGAQIRRCWRQGGVEFVDLGAVGQRITLNAEYPRHL